MDRAKVAEAVRRACVDAARGAYEDAGLSGLCAEGRWEAALSAVARLDLHRVLREMDAGPSSPDTDAEPAT